MWTDLNSPTKRSGTWHSDHIRFLKILSFLGSHTPPSPCVPPTSLTAPSQLPFLDASPLSVLELLSSPHGQSSHLFCLPYTLSSPLALNNIGYLQIHPSSPHLSPELQTYLPNIILDMCTWLSNMPIKTGGNSESFTYPHSSQHLPTQEMMPLFSQ